MVGMESSAKFDMADGSWASKDVLSGFKLGDPTSALILARQFELIEDECATVGVSFNIMKK